jgi:two-component sensor histidine kinase
MQIISSLLNLQSRAVSDRTVLQIFRDIGNRIRSMALVHEQLYQSKDLSTVNLKDYIGELARSILKTFRVPDERIALTLEIDPVGVSIDTITPLGLMLNELLSNSMKHAFPDTRAAAIAITVRREGEESISMRYQDNGIGLPQDYDLRTATTLGMQLICNLAEGQLGAVLQFPQPGVQEGFELIMTLKNVKARLPG